MERLSDLDLKLRALVIRWKFAIIGFEERCLRELLLNREKLLIEEIQVNDLILNSFILFWEALRIFLHIIKLTKI